jgi:hypothetical protein
MAEREHMMCSGFAKWGKGKQAGTTPCSRRACRSFLGKGYCVPHYHEAKALVLDQLLDLDGCFQRGWNDAMAVVLKATKMELPHG